jgi:calcineurin-like phosphoesterase family protein
LDRLPIHSYDDRLWGSQIAVSTVKCRQKIRGSHGIVVGALRSAERTCTHAFNSDQRFVGFEFEYQGDDVLLSHLPANSTLMPTGLSHYVTINREGLLSCGAAKYVSLAPETETEKQWEGLTDIGESTR